MQKVEIIETGEIRSVTNNEAHGLIDSGVARLSSGSSYKTKPMIASAKKDGRKKYQIK